MVVGLLRNSETGMQTHNRLTLLEAVAVLRVLQAQRVGIKYFNWGLSRKVSGRLCWRVPPRETTNDERAKHRALKEPDDIKQRKTQQKWMKSQGTESEYRI